MNTLGEIPYKIIIDLDQCECLIVKEHGEEMTFREYIRRLVLADMRGEKDE